MSPLGEVCLYVSISFFAIYSNLQATHTWKFLTFCNIFLRMPLGKINKKHLVFTPCTAHPVQNIFFALFKINFRYHFYIWGVRYQNRVKSVHGARFWRKFSQIWVSNQGIEELLETIFNVHYWGGGNPIPYGYGKSYF